MSRKPSLRTELLVNLAFLAGAALLLGAGTILLMQSLAPDLTPGQAFPLVLLIVALDVGIFIVFGRYVVTRHVLRPVGRLMAAADAVAAGELAVRAPDAETTDFTLLAERLNHMTDRLLDAQGQVVRAEKLASVGRLAAGIAHEIGNPLGAAGTYVEVLRRRGADAEVIMGLARELERIDRIVRGLLDYARPREEALQPVPLGAVLHASFDLLQAQGAFRRARPTLDAPSEGTLPPILGRAHALEQALVNLLLNAVDAAPDGTVVLGARPWAYEPGHVPPPPRRASDPAHQAFARREERRPSRIEYGAGHPGVLVFVADSGPGVPAGDRDKVFDPFYTTKDPGRGTGLGLAIVARTVDEMRGVIWVDQAREGGAAFKMFFPAAAS